MLLIQALSKQVAQLVALPDDLCRSTLIQALSMHIEALSKHIEQIQALSKQIAQLVALPDDLCRSTLIQALSMHIEALSKHIEQIQALSKQVAQLVALPDDLRQDTIERYKRRCAPCGCQMRGSWLHIVQKRAVRAAVLLRGLLRACGQLSGRPQPLA